MVRRSLTVKDWVWLGMMVATGPVVVRVEDEFTAKAQRSPRGAVDAW